MTKSFPPKPISLQFLKLGGSLITDKNVPRTPKTSAIHRLAHEIAEAISQHPEMRLILGNGAGSFGHILAKKYNTHQGVHTPEAWRGFTEVWREAFELNRLVIDALHTAGLPAMTFPPSAGVIASDGQITSWDLAPIQAALEAGLLPVIHGDVVFDTQRGGTILSTEDLFAYLARHLHPQRILLAGLEEGVWADYPTCTQLILEITPRNINQVSSALGGSTAADVTGGMASKVWQSLTLVQELPNLEVLIFSGEAPGNVRQALLGARVGTTVKASP